MRPTQITEFLTRAMETPDHPSVILWGAPGVGKSSVVKQAAARRRVYEVRAAYLDRTDITGLPVPKQGKAVWWPPEFLPPSDSEEAWVVFYDEITNAPLLVQFALYELLLERRCGNYTLPKNCFQVAAGNRPEDRIPGVRELPSPLANRLCHVNFDLSLEDWVDWALASGVSAEVIAFIRLNDDLLFKFDPDRDRRMFPTPRSVVMADKVWKIHQSTPVVWEAVRGCVGDEWAAKFFKYLEIYKELPDIDAVLRGKNVEVPTRSDLRFAVAVLVGTKAQVEHLEVAVRYASRLPPEISTLLVQLMARRRDLFEPLIRTPAWREWIKTHRDFVAPTR